MSRAPAEPAWSGVAEMFRAFCLGMDTPRSLKAALLVKYGEWEQLARMRIHPTEYRTADSFMVDYAVVSFLKKNKDLPSVCDTRAAAITAFASSEDRCGETNRLIEAWSEERISLPSSVVQVIHLAQRKIARLLREDPNITEGPYSWGPGATYEMSRARAYPDTKIAELPFFVTGGAWKHAVRLIESDLHWKDAIIRNNTGYSGPIFVIVPGGRYSTVEKTVLTDRSILVEPRLNTILQKRIGDQLRGLLKRVDVDLDDQSRNQMLASMARTLDLATLDLEAASDSISRRVVQLLLPPAWFEILDELRSTSVQMDEGWVRLEKFSSMGNGFTFELESLIFWALSSAASEISYRSTVGVYGDDIIVHQDVVPLLTEALRVLGFSLNKEKSFWSGEFFESCGKHYFGGQDVTPLYQKYIPTDRAQASRLGNRLLRFAARLGREYSFDKRVLSAWENWRRQWKVTDDELGPFIGEGDGYWEAAASQFISRIRPSPWGHRCRVKCYSEFVPEIPVREDAMYSNWLMQNRSKVPPLELRGRDCDFARNTVYGTREPLVSVTGTSRKLCVATPSKASSGMILSRVKTSTRWTHRWVEYPGSANLDW